MITFQRAMLFLIALFCFPLAYAASTDQTVEALRKEWAVIKYQTPKKQQIAKFEALIKKAEMVNQQHPNDADVLLWHGTILSTYSSVRGGLGALPFVKEARTLLERSIQLNGSGDNGFAQGVLGAVYARVPGWPIAFGSTQKAREYLETAIRLNPNGLDSNYYYGDFLVDEGEYDLAKKHLEIAQRAPIRHGYEVQDRGRKGEVAQSLAKLKKHLR